MECDSARRVSNVTSRSGQTATDQCVRAKHVCFGTASREGVPSQTYKAGDAALNELLRKGGEEQGCHKSPQLRFSTPPARQSKARRTEHPSESAEEPVKPEDELFNRYDAAMGSRRVVRSKDLMIGIKACGARHSLNPDFFSPKSMRCTYASAARRARVPDEEAHRQGGWAAWSTSTPTQHRGGREGGGGGGEVRALYTEGLARRGEESKRWT